MAHCLRNTALKAETVTLSAVIDISVCLKLVFFDFLNFNEPLAKHGLAFLFLSNCFNGACICRACVGKVFGFRATLRS